MKIIMYHYVRPVSQNGVYAFLQKDDFIEQLRYFQKTHHLLGKDEFCDKLETNTFHADDVLLTFDDGLMDHYEYVFPELKALGITGVFYISTASLTHDTMLDVHLVHCLLAAAPASELMEKLHPLLVPELFTFSHDAQGSMLGTHRYARQNSTELVRTFKKMFNYHIQPQYRPEILHAVAQHFVDEKKLCDDFYVRSEHLQEMHKEGMLIGSHGISHTLLGPLSPEEQQKEIENSFSDLYRAGILHKNLKLFCYPYGGDGAFSEATFPLLEQEGVRLSFNVEARDCTADDISAKHLVPRYDCNMFPHGSATMRTP